jgi:hypothetical protein
MPAQTFVCRREIERRGAWWTPGSGDRRNRAEAFGEHLDRRARAHRVLGCEVAAQKTVDVGLQCGGEGAGCVLRADEGARQRQRLQRPRARRHGGAVGLGGDVGPFGHLVREGDQRGAQAGDREAPARGETCRQRFHRLLAQPIGRDRMHGMVHRNGQRLRRGGGTQPEGGDAGANDGAPQPETLGRAEHIPCAHHVDFVEFVLGCGARAVDGREVNDRFAAGQRVGESGAVADVRQHGAVLAAGDAVDGDDFVPCQRRDDEAAKHPRGAGDRDPHCA